jgi:hypothetical protein
MRRSAQEMVAIIDSLQPTDTDYYLWIATWQPTDAVRAAYRATPAGRALHRRAVRTRDPAQWTPLLQLNAVPVLEELLLEIATATTEPTHDLLTAFWEHVATLPRPSRLLYDPTIRDAFRDWATSTLIPWIAEQTGRDATAIWTATVLPTWEAVRRRPLPAPLSAATAEELIAAAWAPERVVDWCLPHDEASALRRRWPRHTNVKPPRPPPPPSTASPR